MDLEELELEIKDHTLKIGALTRSLSIIYEKLYYLDVRELCEPDYCPIRQAIDTIKKDIDTHNEEIKRLDNLITEELKKEKDI